MYEAVIGDMAARVDEIGNESEGQVAIGAQCSFFMKWFYSLFPRRDAHARRDLIGYQRSGILFLHILLLAYFATSQIGAVIVARYAIRGSTKSRPCPQFYNQSSMYEVHFPDMNVV
jgi:hypothetical protein